MGSMNITTLGDLMKFLTTAVVSLLLSVSAFTHAAGAEFVPSLPYPDYPAPHIQLKGSAAEFLFKIIIRDVDSFTFCNSCCYFLRKEK